MSTPFKPGDEVICIDGKFSGIVHEFFDRLPVKGGRYVVDVVSRSCTLHYDKSSDIGVRLVGLEPLAMDSENHYFSARRFARVGEQEETLSISESIPSRDLAINAAP